ncbi:MAG: DUF1499 domain-containing protein, partial [Halioglobus sp.]|nr:DUF1499 domain-containing protein [Halioglobus sp.]
LTLGGGDYPRIHDITTDTSDPPVFVAAGRERGPNANTLAIKPEVIEQQLAAYPDLATIESALPPGDAFERALSVAQELGWQVYHQDRAAGTIEAVETTSIMAFKDDVVIRIRAAAPGSEIDLRSVSRVGQGDIGANAARIRSFASAFSDG